jgi:YD repeat-containing protein
MGTRPRRAPRRSRHLWVANIVGGSLAFMSSAVMAQGQQPTEKPAECPQEAQSGGAEPLSGSSIDAKGCPEQTKHAEPDQDYRVNDRIFGVLPNYGTVKKAVSVPPLTKQQTLKLAALDSFDPYVFPFVGVVAGLSQLQNQNASFGTGISGYAKRYATSFVDNTIGNYMVEAILPLATGQDSRYFVAGTGSIIHRFGYATSRVAVSRNLRGRRRFNFADIGGNAIAAGLSNVYHPAADRSVSATLTLWATQVMWDAFGNVGKEFWPDIQARLHRRPQPQP